MEETKQAKMLPDDVLREILLRVSADDVAALFRCGITCKHWRALVAERSFLRRRWPHRARHLSSLLGFFVQQRPSDDDDNNNNGSTSFQPAFLPPSSGSVLGSHSRSLASFVPGLPSGELDGAVPLAARHGLLLVRLSRRSNDDPARLAVCNLLAGTCDVLPSLNPGVSAVNCAIITGADYRLGHHERHSPSSPHSYSTSSFKVLAIVIDNSKNHYPEWNNLYTFSSADDPPSWSEPANCFDAFPWRDERHHAVLQWRNKVVVCGGMAHWLVMLTAAVSKYYILRVSIETGEVSLTELSTPAEKLHSTTRCGEPTLFATAAGSLSVFWMQEEGLSLDMCAQGDDGAWLHTRTVELKPPNKMMWNNPSRVHVWSGEKSGMLIVIDTFQCVHLVDVESGVMEDVSRQFQSSWGMMAVPMEIDWPALFLSRLIGRG